MDGCCRVLGDDNVEDGAPEVGIVDNSGEEGTPEWETEDKVNEQRSIRTVQKASAEDMATYI